MLGVAARAAASRSRSSSHARHGSAAFSLAVTSCGASHLARAAAPPCHAGALRFTTEASSRSEEGFAAYTWGLGSSGELGHDFTLPTELPPPPTSAIDAIKGRLIKQEVAEELTPRLLAGYEKGGAAAIDCGRNHTALVQMDGKLLTWGSSSGCKLGHGRTDGSSKDTIVWRPTIVEALEDVKIVHVACGEVHTAAVDDEGRLFTWGSSGSWLRGAGGLGQGRSGDVATPQLVQSLLDDGIRVARVGAGEKHTVILTDDGEAWACGDGEYGMLGNGGSSDRDTPVPVEGLEDFILTDIAVGHSFNLALTAEGLVFGWGRNDAGQLGLGGGLAMDIHAMEELPCLVDSLASAGEKVVAIAAGVTHAAAATESGKLFMWGMKRYLEPEWMTVLDGKQVVRVGCGDRYTVAVTSDHEVYSFGMGKSCCLGHGNKTSQPQPTLVEALLGQRVEVVACGNKHMGALVRPGQAPPTPWPPER